MSGIYGIYHRDGRPVDALETAAMRDRLQAMGRDGASDAGTESVRFGHLLMDRAPVRREKCRTLSQGLSGRGLLLTGDLRLDNRAELTAKLEIVGREAHQASDSELVLRSYERWGADCPEHLLGDFAFAVWDPREQRLLLARDHLGMRPLFYSQVGSTLYFASTMPGLLALPGLPRDLDELIVARHLIWPGAYTGPTLYRSIRAVAPSHTVSIRPTGEPTPRQYWEPDIHQEIRFADPRDYAERCREILFEAVRCRIDSPARVGVMVSGGLDSSTVAGVAENLLMGRSVIGVAHVLEDSPEESKHDERIFLEALDDHLCGMDLRYVLAPDASPLDGVERVHRCLGMPVQAGLNYVLNALFESARDAGCGILLNGEGGDGLISSKCPAYLPGLLRQLRLGRFVREFLAEKNTQKASYRSMLKRSLRPLIPRPLWRMRSNFLYGYTGSAPHSLRADLARELGLREHFADMEWDITNWEKVPTSAHDSPTLSFYVRNGADEHSWVTEAADYGLCIRSPLFDRRLVEYCVAVPGDQKIEHGIGRQLIRKAAGRVLPDSIRLRHDKGVFGPDFPRRLQRDLGRLKGVIDTFRRTPEITKFLDTTKLDAATERLPGYGAHDIAAEADCLNVLLPGYQLGRFLQLEANRDIRGA